MKKIVRIFPLLLFFLLSLPTGVSAEEVGFNVSPAKFTIQDVIIPGEEGKKFFIEVENKGTITEHFEITSGSSVVISEPTFDLEAGKTKKIEMKLNIGENHKPGSYTEQIKVDGKADGNSNLITVISSFTYTVGEAEGFGSNFNPFWIYIILAILFFILLDWFFARKKKKNIRNSN